MARKPADQSVSREAIIVAAADVLQRNGYEATTMKDIAAEVKLTAASLYHHFKNKDMLLLAVLETGIDLVIRKLDPIVQSDLPNAEKLQQMIQMHITNLTKHTAVGAALVFEVRSVLVTEADAPEDAAKKRAFIERRDYFENLYRRVVQAGIDSGEFYPVDAAIFTRTMLGAHNWVSVWFRQDGPLNGEEIAGMIADTFLRSLRPVQ